MKTGIQISEEIREKNALAEAILAECQASEREPNSEEQGSIDKWYGISGEGGEAAELQALLESRTAIEARQREIASVKLGSNIAKVERNSFAQDLVPAKAKRHGNLIAFSNDDRGEKEAYVSGRWFLAKLLNHEPSQRWLREKGLFAQQEESSGKGLELVPEPLEASILKRLTMISTILSDLRTSTMTSATLRIPDRLTGVTVTYPDELAAITPSNMTFGQQLLTAVKMATLTQVSSELSEDSIVSIMDELASDIAYSISLKIEDDIVNGDGTATYGSRTGISASLDANSIIVGAGPAASAFTLANYEACVALNPFFQGAMPQWYCSSSVYASSMLPLLNAAGGTPGSEIAGGYVRQFQGFPVNIVQSMDDGSTISTPQVYFGTLDQAVYFGQRRGVQIAVSEHYGFDTDSLYIRGVTRNAITVDNHDTVVPGPITAIATAAA